MADHQRWALLFSMTEDVLTYHPQVPPTSAGTVMLPTAARLCFQRQVSPFEYPLRDPYSLKQPDLLPIRSRIPSSATASSKHEIVQTICSAQLPVPIPHLDLDEVQPKVAVLLCTFHGQSYLPEQLNSIAAQTHHNWQIWASDDGSLDNTHAILEAYRNSWGNTRLLIRRGPAEGFAVNFMSLACDADIVADFYAYSDQDDIWAPDKLERALKWLNDVPTNVPAVYCSRTEIVDANNQGIGFSPLFERPPCFGNALIQNVGGGNTMVFNNAARQLLIETRECNDNVPHDWWTYMVVTGCGGYAFYDPVPSLRYRQHGGNLVGMNSSWTARRKRVRMIWNGRFRSWNDRNIQALRKMYGRLTPENQEVLDRFAQARNSWLLPRLIGLKRSGIHRQTLLGNLGLVVAALLKKM